MWYDGLFEEMEAKADAEKSKSMSAYMKDLFPFLGLPKPVLSALIKPYMKAGRKQEPFDWNFVFLCWEKPYREAQYVAVGYIMEKMNRLVREDIDKLKRLITEKSWWETVDSLDAACGALVEKHPELKETMREWSRSDNLWLRRTAINFQQRFKENTDTSLLAEIIENNLNSKEFFINKAIGWSLREYSKTDAEWVRAFLSKNESGLASLSKKEASKYL